MFIYVFISLVDVSLRWVTLFATSSSASSVTTISCRFDCQFLSTSLLLSSSLAFFGFIFLILVFLRRVISRGLRRIGGQVLVSQLKFKILDVTLVSRFTLKFSGLMF